VTQLQFTLFDESSAPGRAKTCLEAARKNLGVIPNLERTMAGAPALLEAYVRTWELFDETSLTPIERQVVYQTANFENECEYCVPWHTMLSKLARMDPHDVQALRDGAPLKDAKLEALHRFARAMIVNRGKIPPCDLDAFLAAGYTPQHALEVILGLAIKTMSNYTNSIAGTPLDKTVSRLAWKKPRIPLRQAD
jgi:alkylhydroperoxidase family enzyme